MAIFGLSLLVLGIFVVKREVSSKVIRAQREIENFSDGKGR